MNPIQSDLFPDQMAQRLSSAFQAPGSSLAWNMTPELAYGRHRGPARLRSRQAAVAVVLIRDPAGEWLIPLTRRPTALRHHGGQICFPGGRIEAGETPQQAALREFEEELGVRPDIVATCGQLPNQYVYASDNEVTPVVFVARPPGQMWSPDPAEVDEVLELPLSAIVRDRKIRRIDQSGLIWKTKRPTPEPSTAAAGDGSAKKTSIARSDTIASLDFKAPAFLHQNWQIWGATAVILDQLAQCLRSEPDEPDEPDEPEKISKVVDAANLASSGI